MKIKGRKSRGLTSKNRSTGRSKKKNNKRPAGWLNKNWDEDKSARFNYEQLGLRYTPDIAIGSDYKKEVFSCLSTGSEHVPTKNLVQDWQKIILSVLIKKHKSNYKAMAKDIRINTWQWTAAQIKKMIELGVQ